MIILIIIFVKNLYIFECIKYIYEKMILDLEVLQ